MNQERFPTCRRMGRWCVRVAPRVGFGLLVLFVLAAIPWTYFNIKWGRELEAKLAELKAQGMPLTLAEAAPKPVPASQNAAVLYQEIFGVQFPPNEPTMLEEAMGGLSKDDREVFSAYLKEATPELEGQVRTLLARPQVQQAVETLRRASTRPYSVFPVNWEDGAGALFPHMPMFREASRIMATQSLLLADEGRLDEALDWCEVSLRMSEHAASEPTVIGQLVAYAMQTITFDAVKQIIGPRQLTPGSTARLAARLRTLDLYDTFTAALVGERGMARSSFFDQLNEEPYELYQSFGFRPRGISGVLPRLYFSRLAHPLHKRDQLAYLEYMGQQIETTKLPYREGEEQLDALRRALSRLPTYQAWVTKMLFPVFARASGRREYAVAEIDLCRVVLTLKAYKYEQGAYPDSLGHLQQTLDWELPADPFSGKDFLYQRQGEGFKLYSIGQDLEDDGGIAPKEPPENLAWDEADIVWQCVR